MGGEPRARFRHPSSGMFQVPVAVPRRLRARVQTPAGTVLKVRGRSPSGSRCSWLPCRACFRACFSTGGRDRQDFKPLPAGRGGFPGPLHRSIRTRCLPGRRFRKQLEPRLKPPTSVGSVCDVAQEGDWVTAHSPSLRFAWLAPPKTVFPGTASLLVGKSQWLSAAPPSPKGSRHAASYHSSSVGSRNSSPGGGLPNRPIRATSAMALNLLRALKPSPSNLQVLSGSRRPSQPLRTRRCSLPSISVPG